MVEFQKQNVLLWIFVDVKSGATLKPDYLIAFGLRSQSCKSSSEIYGGKVTLCAGLDGFVASLMAY